METAIKLPDGFFNNIKSNSIIKIVLKDKDGNTYDASPFIEEVRLANDKHDIIPVPDNVKFSL